MTGRQLSPDVFTADYVGRPGGRTFYLQVRGPEGAFSYVLEKQQLALLAEKLQEILLAIDHADTVRGASPQRDPALALEEPVLEEWRVGAIGLGFDETNDRVIVLLRPVTDTDPNDDLEDDDAGDRFSVRRDQVRGFVLHVAAVVAEGRPTCPLCGLPIDSDGHRCPAVNGHHPAE